MTIQAPEAFTWQEAPPVLPRGARMAVLKGDPSREGLFILRLKAPDNYQIMPHWHPAYENVTVLAGKVHFGMGDTFSKTGGSAVGVGGFVSMPPGMRHYAWTEGETELELVGYGPWQLYYLNPKDDPRQAAAPK